MEFLQEIVPASVFSAGSGRRRRRGTVAAADGRRSDQGYLVFYEAAAGDRAPRLQPLKAMSSIRAYLEARVASEPADVWVCTQTTQFRARRDGKILTMGFTADQARHILNIVIDLDGSRMDPAYRRLLDVNPVLLLDLIQAQLQEVGVDRFLVVQSSPGGLHVYLPLLRPDGRPLRASEQTMAAWERVAKGACRLLSPFGADPNAVKPTQPFIIPGLARAKHPGFIPFVIRRSQGEANNLYALLRRLSARRLVPARERIGLPTHETSEVSDEPTAIIAAVQDQAVGVARGNRNQVAHDLAVFLLAKGATVTQAEAALTAWNRRNDPPLSRRELAGCLCSAERCSERNQVKWAEMQRAPWNRLRAIVGLPSQAPTGYLKAGRWRPLTPAKPWEVRKQTGGREHYEEVAERLLRLVAGEGGHLEMTQAEIADVIDTNRSTLRAVLRLLEASGQLQVSSRRGRGGTTVLTVPVAAGEAAPLLTKNGQSGISTEGAKVGARVGPGERTVDARALRGAGASSSPSPLALLCSVVRQVVGVDLSGESPCPVVMAWESGEGCWRVVGMTALGSLALSRLGESTWWMRELERVVGGRVHLEVSGGIVVSAVAGERRSPGASRVAAKEPGERVSLSNGVQYCTLVHK